MAKLLIEQDHALDAQTARARLDGLKDRLSEKFGVAVEWTSDTEASIKGTGVAGTITCQPERVAIALDLSFALLPVRSMIEGQIKKELGEALGAPAA